MKRFAVAAWHWTDRLLPVAFWIGSVVVFYVGFTLWQTVEENTDAREALVVQVADEVQRRQEGFCEVLDELWPAIARGLLGADPTDPDYRDDLTPVQRARDDAIRAEIRRTFPILEDCNLPPLIEEEG